MESGKETHNNNETEHEIEQRLRSNNKSPTVARRQSMIEGNPAAHKKERYFSKFSNWVSLLTLLFVAAYTVITFVQWRSNHIFDKKQLRSIDAQLSEMRVASDISQKTFVMAQRPWLYVKGNVNYTWGNAAYEFLETVVINRGNAIAINVSIAAEYTLLDEPMRFGKGHMEIDPRTVNCVPDLSRELWKFRKIVAIPPRQEQPVRFFVEVREDEAYKFRGMPRTSPYLVGCIQYSWPFTGNTFDTYFQVRVTLVDGTTGDDIRLMQPINKPLASYKVRPIGEIEYIHAN
jgi:hypothetical protein